MATLFEEVRVFDGTVEITCKPHALKMAVVRDAKDLGDQWKSPGIYVLLGTPREGSWRAYVGKSNQLSGRFAQDRDFEWYRALLVRHSFGFDSAEAGWLEGRMHGLLEAGGVELENTQRPGDPTLPASKQESLERYVEVIQDALVLLGYDLSGRRQVHSGQPVTPTAEVEYGEAGKVHRRLLHVVDVGTQIESTSPSHGANATVEGTGIRYDGELYNSLSAAAKAVTGDDTADGWSFWGLRLESGVVKKLKLVRDAHGDDVQSPPRRGAKGGRKRRNKTTPARMSETKRTRLLSRRDQGATYAELRREFGMSQAGVLYGPQGGWSRRRPLRGLDDGVLRSPFTGVVADLHVEAHDNVTAQQVVPRSQTSGAATAVVQALATKRGEAERHPHPVSTRPQRVPTICLLRPRLSCHTK